ncbi:uncharacterized protein LOC129616511 [Condylostylus longicornis]|uniref:uncharacterized protein LOC129616511 n=1 Tax=Condylostylus longicornis TaxID=2530218 RepID=UPI00244DECD9|nr:uncharacterized protein LOC129616511 [Condylostylus longicornis]
MEIKNLLEAIESRYISRVEEMKRSQEVCEASVREVKNMLKLTDNFKTQSEKVCQELQASKNLNDELLNNFKSVVNESILVIKPKTSQTSEITKQVVKKQINPVNLKVGGLAKNRDGAISIVCDNAEMAEKQSKYRAEDMINGVYLNIQGLTSNFAALEELVCKCKSDFVILSETHITEDMNVGKLTNYLENNMNFAENYCIAGDFNLDYLCNSAAKRQIEQLLKDYGLKQLINEPTRVTNVSGTLIDYVLVNQFPKIEARINKDLNITDHEMISINVIIESNKKTPEPNIEDLNSCVLNLENAIKHSIQKLRKSITVRNNKAEWFNEELNTIKLNKIHLRSRHTMLQSHDSWKQYTKIRNEYKKKCQEAKNKYIETKIESKVGNPKEMWRTIKKYVLLKDEYYISELEINNKKINCKEVFLPILVQIINKSFEDGKFPEAWKESVVVPVNKVKNAKSADNMRPINMMPLFEKVLEKVVCNQLENFLERNEILCKEQSGFRKAHSTETSLTWVLNEWRKETDSGKMIVAVFLDLKRAFETISREILISKLKSYGIRNKELSWFSSYLSSRSQRTKLKDVYSDARFLDLGVPQGTILGVVLFLLYINDIQNVLIHSKVCLFADDTLTYIVGKNADIIEQQINSDMGNLHKWLCRNKLMLNTSKTKVMCVNGGNRNIAVKVDNVEIESVQSIKYLGVFVDNKLKFDEHTDYIRGKISKKIGFLARIRKSVSEKCAVMLYNSLILPHIDYCSSILFICSEEKRNKLQKLQNRAMRIILKVNKRTSIKFELRRRKLQFAKRW